MKMNRGCQVSGNGVAGWTGESLVVRGGFWGARVYWLRGSWTCWCRSGDAGRVDQAGM